jgi:hypothetical protein
MESILGEAVMVFTCRIVTSCRAWGLPVSCREFGFLNESISGRKRSLWPPCGGSKNLVLFNGPAGKLDSYSQSLDLSGISVQ